MGGEHLCLHSISQNDEAGCTPALSTTQCEDLQCAALLSFFFEIGCAALVPFEPLRCTQNFGMARLEKSLALASCYW